MRRIKIYIDIYMAYICVYCVWGNTGVHLCIMLFKKKKEGQHRWWSGCCASWLCVLAGLVLSAFVWTGGADGWRGFGVFVAEAGHPCNVVGELGKTYTSALICRDGIKLILSSATKNYCWVQCITNDYWLCKIFCRGKMARFVSLSALVVTFPFKI